MEILYLVHDLSDPAVGRRVKFLVAGGARVRLAGFTRGGAVPRDAVSVLHLGPTSAHQFQRRAMGVLARWLRPGQLARYAETADLILSRNLETLVLAARIRGLRPLVYEFLDLHRLMLGQNIPGRLLRLLERRLLAQTRLLLVSSPAYVRHYFEAVQGYRGPVRLLENKALKLEGGDRPAIGDGPSASPWVIGWFGLQRCNRSFQFLLNLGEQLQGKLKVLIAGNPDRSLLVDFDAKIAASAHVDFLGGYTLADLATLYGRTHFAWAIDWYEAGANSDWLLPNRIYEGPYYGAVPIALARVETGRWLAQHEAGLRLEQPERELVPFFEGLTADAYAALRSAIGRIPASALQLTASEAQEFVAELQRLTQAG